MAKIQHFEHLNPTFPSLDLLMMFRFFFPTHEFIHHFSGIPIGNHVVNLKDPPKPSESHSRPTTKPSGPSTGAPGARLLQVLGCHQQDLGGDRNAVWDPM